VTADRGSDFYMCLAIPSKIVSIENYSAVIDVFGARKEVSLMLMPEETRVGDYVLVHAGFAIQKVDKDIVESGKSMHETALALSILDIIVAKCSEAGGHTVDSVRVRIGKAAGVMPDALLFAFDASKASTVAENARMEIEPVLVGGVCKDCRKEFTSEAQYVFKCPHCGSQSFEITSGREMEIVDMEIS
jgi:hydrogenase nickel incorporation protein HypA/HybF